MNFTPKTEEALAWDRVKAVVTAKINLEVADYRMRRRNEMLSELWPAFQASLSGETVLDIDPEMEHWISDSVRAIETRTGQFS